jgi:hypothetical protein
MPFDAAADDDADTLMPIIADEPPSDIALMLHFRSFSLSHFRRYDATPVSPSPLLPDIAITAITSAALFRQMSSLS